MHENVPVRFGRGRLDSLGNKGLAAYLIATLPPPSQCMHESMRIEIVPPVGSAWTLELDITPSANCAS